jgi:stage V sporulation protein R
MNDWTIKDLIKWNRIIEDKAREMGLDFYPQEFEICDYHDMLGYQSYMGMPSRYPHWSFGKSYEKQKTLYKFKLTGLAYEMVINSNPCVAYLMIDNPLAMQVLTMAHVYGHNDFFKNNMHFSQTRADLALEMFKRHADRVRTYVEDPGIGYQKVERILDAAHAISLQCSRNIFVEELSLEEQKKRFYKNLNKPEGEWDHLKQKEKKKEPVFKPAPEKDLLMFIRDHQPFLEDWEKDLLTIVREETNYFLPQMETKIMNEGWATFWHYTILNRLDLPASMHFDFLRSHNQVIRPMVGGLNPYHIGYLIFSRLAGKPEGELLYDINPQIFEVREIDRDSSFLRRFLTKELAQELNLFEYMVKPDTVKVTEVADEEGWIKIRESMIANIGLNSQPVIEANPEPQPGNTLSLQHRYDGRELQMKYVEETMKYINRLWREPVVLNTFLDGKPIKCKCQDQHFSILENDDRIFD